ncbi:MAG: FAD-dependent oxidoreductase [Verrucomicrobiota bacterium]
MDSIKLRINGRDVEARPGMTVLEVVQEHQLDDIPTLCHARELEPYGSCFLCVVEVKGRPSLVPACATRVAPGMEVQTRNDRILASRKTALELLLSNHYADCIPPCRIACPAGVDTQGYLALSAMGHTRESVDLIRETNPLPAVCGRVCVRKCELECRRADIDSPVGINAVKRYVTDAPGAYDGKPVCEPPTGKSVGIIGGGPAGLTAAWFLARKGHRAVIYEAMPRAGGMLRYGIPTYRLPDDVIDREIDYIARAGVEIRCGARVGKDLSLDDLRKKHDAVFIGAGAWGAKPMGVDGEFDTQGIVTGVDFLREKAQKPEPVRGTVVVVGGGNTAIDVARTAWRLGADKVILLYRRTRAEMPADDVEIADCLAEGVELMELAAPVGLTAEGRQLKALRCIRMKLGEPDKSGRRRPVPLEGSEFDLPCQLAVSAIGQSPVLDGLLSVGGGNVARTKWETVVVDPVTMSTNIPGVFAGGDVADDGPTVVIDAVSDGQKAARGIHAFLTGRKPEPPPFVVTKAFWGKPDKSELGDIKESPRHEVHHLDVAKRAGSFEEVATGFDPEDNVHETGRCLSCGCLRYEDCGLRLYAGEYGVDMERYKGHVRKHKIDDRHPYVAYDPNKCILCSRCIRTCSRMLPLSALGLVARGFKTEMRPAMNDPLVETSCVSCGNCIDACPTAALTVKYCFPGRASLAAFDVETHCALCSVGCPITVKKFGDDRYFISGSGVPGEYLCRYGRFGVELFIKRKRIARPLVRTGNAQADADLAGAHRRIADSMKAAAAKHGPEAVAVFVSPELTNEELYLAGRIAREGLGTGNIGSLSILGAGRESGGLDASLGFTASTADRSVLADADLIVCSNTNLEADHLVLNVDVMAAVRRGAKLIVASSALDPADQALATLAMDPMRGRAAILWNGILQVLLDEGHLKLEAVRKLPGGEDFLRNRGFDMASVTAQTGVEEADIRRAAVLVREARRIVFISSPDRPQDRAGGDLQTLANAVLLLSAAGVRADLLLPRAIGNSAGLEISGADPAFGAGRRRAADLPGARTHEDLRRMLSDGSLKAALILGEDPMRHDRTAAWFRNVEFLAAMDWAETETTRAADVVLPGATYLETEGTRCNFEGRLLAFARAVRPPSGKAGWDVLGGLAGAFGVKVHAGSAVDLKIQIEDAIREGLDGAATFYWNAGGARRWPGTGRLMPVEPDGRAAALQVPLTHGEAYKKSLREVGTGRYRVV